MKAAKIDIAGSVICALFGVAVWAATDMTVRGDDEGLFHTDARLFPHFIAFMITLISMIWLGRSLWTLRSGPGEGGEAVAPAPAQPVEWSAQIRVALFIGLFFGYAALVKPLGFMASSLLAGLAALAILREKRPLVYVAVTVCSLLLYGVFQYLLKVRLP